MRKTILSEQINSKFHSSLREHDKRFAEYTQEQIRTNPKYYAIQCHLKYDFIRFSVYLNRTGKIPDESKLQPLLNEIWFRRTEEPDYNFIPLNRVKFHWKYDRVTKYKFSFENQIYEMIIAKCSRSNLYPYIFTIHDPTYNLLLFLKPFLEDFHHYHVKEIEHTFDFVFDELELVRDFLIQQTVVKWQGRSFGLDNCSTRYMGNPRVAQGKGGRIYNKPLAVSEHEESVRLELLLKRPILKRNGIKNIKNVIESDNKIVMKYLQFKKFNTKKLRKRMLSIGSIQSEIDNEIISVIDRIKEGYSHEVNKEYLLEYKKYYSDSFLNKSIYWKHFVERIGRNSFLTRDVFTLSHGLMMDELIH